MLRVSARRLSPSGSTRAIWNEPELSTTADRSVPKTPTLNPSGYSWRSALIGLMREAWNAGM